MSDETARETENKTQEIEVVDEVARSIVERFEEATAYVSHGQSVVYLPASDLADAALALRDDHAFGMCIDITAVDHLLDGTRHCPPSVTAERFEIVANFLSHTRNQRIRLIAQVPEAGASVPTLTTVYPGTAFSEREVFDLYGIRFEGHPDLTRILLPDDWDGWPLRKDDHPARVPVTFKGDPSPR